MPILNYTTKIDFYKTITEITQILSKAGANKVVMDNENGLPVALTFTINWNGNMVAFALPCHHKGVLKAMHKNKKVARSQCTDEQALRVGWRITKNWVETQLAIVEAEMAELPEVFLPYAITKNGKTMYELISTDNQILLTQ